MISTRFTKYLSAPKKGACPSALLQSSFDVSINETEPTNLLLAILISDSSKLLCTRAEGHAPSLGVDNS